MNLPIGTILITNRYKFQNGMLIWTKIERTLLQITGKNTLEITAKDLISDKEHGIIEISAGIM